MAVGTQRNIGRRAGLVPLAFAIVAASLTGCVAGTSSATPGSATATPEPSATPTVVVGEPITGTGPIDGAPLAAPAGTQSVTIAFECAGDIRFSVELTNDMTGGMLVGDCGSTNEMTWPLPSGSGSGLFVYLPDDIDWVATPTFSSAPFVYDDALTEDCAAFADAESALMNADQGYTLYDAFEEDEWTSRVDGAVADLTALAETASPSIAEAIATVAAEASAPDRTVGMALTDEAHTAADTVSAECNRNQTPIILSGEFGG
ncbi:hypothetical protein [Labedella endophytica]|uniref:Septum formation-related domain-containing protein n=1 Tax=Labedella endophytica TaxID=1523160 RepID=A0A3S0VIT3_9MICO|nr:hypothetical protein [Labedella endophytica]RUR03556.1 hypothetical protein ELQ94_03230 [Labedella endophytica]